MAERRERRSREERAASLLEDVREMLREQGKELDAETLAALTGACGEGRVIEGGPSRMAVLWRVLRLPALMILAALMVMMLYLFFDYGRQQPPAKSAPDQHRTVTTTSR